MSDTPCLSPGEFSWNELVTTNAKGSADFYTKLFGWHTETFAPPGTPAGAPAYQLFKNEANPRGIGGMMQAMHPQTPTHWVPYVVVANIDDSLAKAVALGAITIVPVMSVPGVGRVAVVKDPQGATLGLHEVGM